MKQQNLAPKNLAFFRRYYRLVALAVMIAVGVIVGSLMIGDSVRNTLINRVTERLGDTQSIVFSKSAFMHESFAQNKALGNSARGILMSNGFISHRGQLLPVVVWGVDDLDIQRGEARINLALHQELGEAQTLVLRLPSTGMVPSGSLFVSKNYTTSLRLQNTGMVPVKAGGNLSLKNEQTIPLNIFVNRSELAEQLETPQKINLILSAEKLSDDVIAQAWDYTVSGLSVERKTSHSEIRSDRVFLPQDLVNCCMDFSAPNRLFSYLANSIVHRSDTIPYSFATAMDSYCGEPLQKHEAILSDYSAARLKAQIGDSISLAYFTSADLKTLETQSARFLVKAIVPIAELQADSSLSANFPGLSDVDDCTDWDSDLPIDLSRVKDDDEAYWDCYRSTPKILIAYDAVADHWGNAYGVATAMRTAELHPDLSQLRPEMFGIQLIHPREAGLHAAQNSIDFSSLFLALGFFIIIAALLLMQIPLAEMLEVRKGEIALLQAIGFSRKAITKLFMREAIPLVFLSAVAGVLLGIAYTSVVMWLLGNLWHDATHTVGFGVHLSMQSIGVGLLVGVVLAISLARQTIRKQTAAIESKATARNQKSNLLRKRRVAILSISITLAAVLANLFFMQSVAIFVVISVLLMTSFACFGDYILCKKAVQNDYLNRNSVVWKSLFANRKQAIRSFLSLALGVFVVFSVGLNRQGFADSSKLKTGSGGYSMWAESSVPIYHNLQTEEGRAKLSLAELPVNAEIMQCLRFSADEASCLNLNKVGTPNVLGVDMAVLERSSFQIKSCVEDWDKENIFSNMQSGKQQVYPALVDETVLLWSLGMQLGDTVFYADDIAVRLVGTLVNSVFQGNILIDRSLFSSIWTATTGSEVFLVKVDEEDKVSTQQLLAQALSEYGVRVSTTNERLKQFNSVTDAYLTIFMTLGCIGLLLGVVSFVIVCRKNLLGRKIEIELYRTLGFSSKEIQKIQYRENIIVPLYALAAGVGSALVGVGASFLNVSLGLWLMAVGFAALFVGVLRRFVRITIKNQIQ